MALSRVSRFLGASVFAFAGLSGVALAQDYDRPPGDVPNYGDSGSEAGALALRVERLESALRRATGQIEELQNDNRRLAEQLRKFREDVEYRLGARSGAADIGAPPSTAASEPSRAVRRNDGDIVAPESPAPPKVARRNDSFDPTGDPSAPGAPKPLGSTAASAPLNLASRAPDTPAATRPLPSPPPQTAKKPEEEPNFVPSGVPFSDSKEQFKAALAAYKAGQYSDAESLFKAYLDANKGASNAADAVFYIGETYLQRSRPREAAEQYLKVSTEYSKSPRAAESMMRLGQSLAMLGNKEQACATFAEVGKRYPAASPSVKKSVDREIQSHRCT